MDNIPYSCLFDQLTDAMVALTPDNRVIFWNPAAERLLGYNAQDVLGQPLQGILFPTDFSPLSLKTLKTVLESEGSTLPASCIEIEVLHQQGWICTVEVSISMLPVVADYHMILILRDTTDKKHKRDNLLRKIRDLQHLLDAKTAQISRQEHHKRLITKACQEFQNYSDEDSLLQAAVKRIGQSVEASYTCIWKFSSDNAYILPHKYDYCYGTDNASPQAWIPHFPFDQVHHLIHPSEANASNPTREAWQFPLSSHNRLLGIIKIETPRVSQQANNQRLELLIALNERLASAIDRIQAYSQRKTSPNETYDYMHQILTFISHQVKPNLSAILGYSDMLCQEIAGILTTKQRKYVHHISLSALRLTDIINDVSDFTKLETGNLSYTPEWVELRPLIKEIIDFFQPLTLQKGIQLCFDIDPALLGLYTDPAYIKQLFCNLLRGIIKWNDRDAGVVITMFRDESQEWFVCQIQGRGMALPTQSLETLFQPFTQRHTDVCYLNDHDMVGLGLCLAKRLIEYQGGHVFAESIPEVGTQITWRLPTKLLTPALSSTLI